MFGPLGLKSFGFLAHTLWQRYISFGCSAVTLRALFCNVTSPVVVTLQNPFFVTLQVLCFCDITNPFFVTLEVPPCNVTYRLLQVTCHVFLCVWTLLSVCVWPRWVELCLLFWPHPPNSELTTFRFGWKLLTVFGDRDTASSGVDTSIPKRLPPSSLDDDEPNSMSYFLVWYSCVSELCVFVLSSKPTIGKCQLQMGNLPARNTQCIWPVGNSNWQLWTLRLAVP